MFIICCHKIQEQPKKANQDLFNKYERSMEEIEAGGRSGPLLSFAGDLKPQGDSLPWT